MNVPFTDEPCSLIVSIISKNKSKENCTLFMRRSLGGENLVEESCLYSPP